MIIGEFTIYKIRIMKIEYYLFPEDILYDTENFVWAEISSDEKINSNNNIALIGSTPTLSTLAAKMIAIRTKDCHSHIVKGKSLGTIENNSYFGVIQSPLNGRIIEVNNKAIDRPKLVSDLPFSEG